MPLKDQVLITGTTLVLEEIQGRRRDLPYPIDVAALREAPDPAVAAGVAREISALYAEVGSLIGPDGVDENWRISNMTKVVAETIERYYS